MRTELPLEQHDTPPGLRQPRRRGSAGRPAADHHGIGIPAHFTRPTP
jgi:hypothetical protein